MDPYTTDLRGEWDNTKSEIAKINVALFDALEPRFEDDSEENPFSDIYLWQGEPLFDNGLARIIHIDHKVIDSEGRDTIAIGLVSRLDIVKGSHFDRVLQQYIKNSSSDQSLLIEVAEGFEENSEGLKAACLESEDAKIFFSKSGCEYSYWISSYNSYSFAEDSGESNIAYKIASLPRD